MTFSLQQLDLASDTPGTTTSLSWYTAGPDDADIRIHLQAALHADEQPGTMALHHLLPRLRDADEAGRLKAHFTVFPAVNPLGLAQRSLGHHIGRYDTETGVNFNRRWPRLWPLIADRVGASLTDDSRTNVWRIRQSVIDWIDEQIPTTAAGKLRLLVLRSAVQADIVLDLHCDDESLKHIFTSPELMPGLQDLADCMGVAATLTAEDSGGGSFDEVLPTLYREAQAAFPSRPVPGATAAATLEYRGQADTNDDFGAQDAAGLFSFFQGRGLAAGDGAPLTSSAPPPVPFAATEVLRVTAPGLLAYRVQLGDVVRRGDVVADLIAMDGPGAFLERTPIRAGTDGFVLSRRSGKYVKRGDGIVKIVGQAILPSRAGGYLLED